MAIVLKTKASIAAKRAANNARVASVKPAPAAQNMSSEIMSREPAGRPKMATKVYGGIEKATPVRKSMWNYS